MTSRHLHQSILDSRLEQGEVRVSTRELSMARQNNQIMSLDPRVSNSTTISSQPLNTIGRLGRELDSDGDSNHNLVDGFGERVNNSNWRLGSPPSPENRPQSSLTALLEQILSRIHPLSDDDEQNISLEDREAFLARLVRRHTQGSIRIQNEMRENSDEGLFNELGISGGIDNVDNDNDGDGDGSGGQSGRNVRYNEIINGLHNSFHILRESDQEPELEYHYHNLPDGNESNSSFRTLTSLHSTSTSTNTDDTSATNSNSTGSRSRNPIRSRTSPSFHYGTRRQILPVTSSSLLATDRDTSSSSTLFQPVKLDGMQLPSSWLRTGLKYCQVDEACNSKTASIVHEFRIHHVDNTLLTVVVNLTIKRTTTCDNLTCMGEILDLQNKGDVGARIKEFLAHYKLRYWKTLMPFKQLPKLSDLYTEAFMTNLQRDFIMLKLSECDESEPKPKIQGAHCLLVISRATGLMEGYFMDSDKSTSYFQLEPRNSWPTFTMK